MADLDKLWLWQEARKNYRREEERLHKNPTYFELKKAKKEILAVEAAVEEHEKRLRELGEKLASAESRCTDLRNKAELLSNRLYSGDTKNLKELAGLQQQVEAMKKELESTEEELLQRSIEHDELREQLSQIKAGLKEEKNRYRERLAAYNAWKGEVETNLGILQAECSRLETEVNPDLMRLYLEMTARYGDSVLARLENNLCTACRVRVPTLLTKELHQGYGLVRCENCGRILYWRN